VSRIAVVDDDQTLLELLHDFFSDQGWELLACPDGDTAFDRLKGEAPDVMLLDLVLPAPSSG